MSASIGVMIDGIAEGLMEQTITAASATNVPPRQIGLSGTAPRTGFVPQQPPRSSYGARRNGSDWPAARTPGSRSRHQLPVLSVQAIPFHRTMRSSPAAQALRAEVAATPYKPLPGWGLGLGTWLHRAPFQCRMKVLPLPVFPTAQALSADSVAAPSSAARSPGTGLALRAQLLPFHRKIRNLPLSVLPTAHALRLDAAAAPWRMLPPGTVGAAAWRHLVPFQCRISGCEVSAP